MKLTLVTLAALLTAASAQSPGYAHLHFDVLKGDTLEEAHKDNKVEFAKRAGSAELVLTNKNFFYAANLKLGSEEEEVQVLVDTGSSDLWVMGANNVYCKPDNPDPTKSKNPPPTPGKGPSGPFDTANIPATVDCKKYGTFDTSKSDTWKPLNDGKKFAIIYGDSTFALGPWGKDTVKFGDFTLNEFQFAAANQSTQKMGILGVGLTTLETTFGRKTTPDIYEYPNFPAKMVEEGYIHRNVYSLWLNEASAATGSLLFGAVDHAKYKGGLTIVPVLNLGVNDGYDKPFALQVTMNSVKVGDAVVLDKQVHALLDSGTTLTYLESVTVEGIAKEVNAPWNEGYGFYARECPGDNDKVVTFNFQSSSVSVPIKNLFYSAKDGTNMCILGLVKSDDFNVLGDGFLQAAYIVYDLENFQIAIGQGVITDKEDIEVIVDKIPGATSAKDYYKTYVYHDKYAPKPVNLVGRDVTTTGSSASASATSKASSSASNSTSSAMGASNYQIPSIFSSLVAIGGAVGLLFAL